MKTLSLFGYWLTVVSLIATALVAAGLFSLVMIAGETPEYLPIPDYINDWTLYFLWAGAGVIATLVIGLVCWGIGKWASRFPRLMVHPVPDKAHWMWRRVGVWHGSKNGSPVLKYMSSWRTVMAVYIRLWNGNLLVFQWRGFRRESRL